MGALKVLVFVTWAVFLLENGSAAPSGTYSFTTLHRSSSSPNSISGPLTASKTPTSASPAAGSHGRGDLGFHDYRRYLPVEDTPEVKQAREQFFRLYEKQARMAAEAPDNDLDGSDNKIYVMTKAAGEDMDHERDYYNYDYEDDHEEEEGEGSEEEDEVGGDDGDEEEEEEEDSSEGDEGEEDSSEDEGDDSEEGESSSAEDEEDDDSSEEGEDSSSEEGDDDGEDSSSSSSEEDYADGRNSLNVPFQNINSVSAPRPVTDTPEVKKAKKNFFDLYKTQAELSFRAPDDH